MKTAREVAHDIVTACGRCAKDRATGNVHGVVCTRLAEALEARDAEWSARLTVAREALAKCTQAMAMQVGRENETLHIKQEVAREIWDVAYAQGLSAIEAISRLAAPPDGGTGT